VFGKGLYDGPPFTDREFFLAANPHCAPPAPVVIRFLPENIVTSNVTASSKGGLRVIYRVNAARAVIRITAFVGDELVYGAPFVVNISPALTDNLKLDAQEVILVGGLVPLGAFSIINNEIYNRFVKDPDYRFSVHEVCV